MKETLLAMFCLILTASTLTVDSRLNHSASCDPRLGYHRCAGSSRCIPKGWLCNGKPDCPDGTDEINYCESKKCDANQFQCEENKECIAIKWRCDNVNDCPDNSDEKNCEPGVEQCLPSRNLYECSNLQACIPLQHVCDKQPHCNDNSDEGPQCDIPCNNSTCEQNCVPTPRGPVCLCGDGYKLAADKRSCIDINECSTWPPRCSQHCTNTVGGFNCSCNPRYQLYLDKKQCKATGRPANLLYSAEQSIMKLNLQTLETTIIQKDIHLGQIHKMAVDQRDRTIYWIESDSISIRSMSLEGGQITDVITTGLKTPMDLAVDWIGRNLYIVDEGRKQILTCLLDGSMCAIIIERGSTDKPRAIALQPQQGKLFWTDWGENPSIISCAMDGLNCHPLVTTDIIWPNGLVLDDTTGRLFWVDAKRDTAESVLLDGSDRRLHLELDGAHPYFVSVFEDELFWSDWYLSGIMVANKMTGKNMYRIVDEDTTTLSVIVEHPVLQTEDRGACWNNHCSHLCLLNQKSSYTCACPIEMVLADDGRTCESGFKSTSILIAGLNSVDYIFLDGVGGSQKLQSLIMNSRMGSTRSLAYDPSSATILYGDNSQGTISRSVITSQNTRKSNVLVDSLWTITDIAVDYISGNIYWVDSDRGMLGVTTSDGSFTITLLEIKDPSSVALSPKRSFLFFVFDDPRGSHINRCDMSCDQCLIITDGVDENRVTSLIVDREEHNLYWISETDEEESVIFTANLGGDYLKIVYKSSLPFYVGHCIDLAMHDDTLYWIEKVESEDVIYYTNITERLNAQSSKKHLLYSSTQDMYNIEIIDPDRKINGSTLCSVHNGGCSHVCLIKNQTSVSCHCPGSMVLDSSGKQCQRSCTEGKFQCLDKCINLDRVCDGTQDCLNNADEKHCEVEVISDPVPPTMFPTLSSHSCPPGLYSCDSVAPRCIAKHRLCDGVYDCPRQEDEQNCSSCAPGLFKCVTTSQCIYNSAVCDWVNDCEDASDEETGMCDRHRKSWVIINDPKNDQNIKPVLDKCKDSSMHQCSNGFCLSQDRVCDRRVDCDDGSDEGRGCELSCASENGGCDQICRPTPHGALCSCFKGYKLHENKKSCRDINECDIHQDRDTDLERNYCSQLCVNAIGSYNCTCTEGYYMDEYFNTCLAEGFPPSIIIGVENMIQILDLDRNREVENIAQLPRNDIAKVIAISHDSLFGNIYWSEIGHVENKQNFISYYDRHLNKVIRAKIVGQCQGLAVDWISRNLYMTVIDEPHIAVCSLKDLDQCATIVNYGLDKPRGIAVDPHEGVMFWTEWGEFPKIEKAWLSGESRHSLVIHEVTWPNDVALDMILKRVYWADSKLDRIESISYNGEDRHVVFAFNDMHPFGLSLLEDWLYWTDWGGHVLKMNRFVPEKPTTLHENLDQPNGIVVAHVSKQSTGVNRCKNSPCSHLCVQIPESFSCLCPVGFRIRTGNIYECEKIPANEMKGKRPISLGGNAYSALTLACEDSLYCLHGGNCTQDVNGSVSCSCPMGFTGLRCDNDTGIILSYPVLGGSNYAWIAGLLVIILITIVATILAIYCWRRKRHMTQSDIINIIRFRSKIFGKRDADHSHLVTSSFENPSFHGEEGGDSDSTTKGMETDTDTKVCMIVSPSEESIDSAFLSRNDTNNDCDSEDDEESDTRPLTDQYARAV